MLELAILGLLKEQAMHGYELRKQLGQRLGFFWTVSFGSLYPTLRRLERRGAVEKIFPSPQTSRRKQVYRITESGEREFFEQLSEGSEAAEGDKFPLRLAFFGYLRPETRIRLLERRKTYLEDKLEQGRRSLRRANGARSDRYTLSLMRHGMRITEADIAWLEGLIAAERASLVEQVPEPPATPPGHRSGEPPPEAPPGPPSGHDAGDDAPPTSRPNRPGPEDSPAGVSK